MDKKEYLEAIAANSERLAAAVRTAGREAAVPTCPEWKVADLIEHMAGVHRWVLHIFENQAQEMPDRKAIERPPDDADMLEWFEEGVPRLLEALDRAGPDYRVWNWIDGGPGDSSFWPRRMAHEVVIHRVDGESAAGVAGTVEPAELAVDGIDELLSFLDLRGRYDKDGLGFEGTFHFHATDTPGEWLVEVAPGAVSIRREHAKAPVAVRGPAGALELFLYNRGPGDDLEVLGDAALMDAWRERFHF